MAPSGDTSATAIAGTENIQPICRRLFEYIPSRYCMLSVLIYIILWIRPTLFVYLFFRCTPLSSHARMRQRTHTRLRTRARAEVCANAYSGCWQTWHRRETPLRASRCPSSRLMPFSGLSALTYISQSFSEHWHSKVIEHCGYIALNSGSEERDRQQATCPVAVVVQ